MPRDEIWLADTQRYLPCRMGWSTNKSAKGGLQRPKSRSLHRREQQLWPHAFPKRDISRQLLLRHLPVRWRVPQSNLTLLLPNVKLWPFAIYASSENGSSSTLGTCRRITAPADRTTDLRGLLSGIGNRKAPPLVHGILQSRFPPRGDGNLPPQRNGSLPAPISLIHFEPIPPVHGAPFQHNPQFQQP